MAKKNENPCLTFYDQWIPVNGYRHHPLLRKLLDDSKLVPNLSPVNPLTLQETLCLILLAQGLSPDQCAEVLHIRTATVRTYEQRVREKLKASHRVHAFCKALQQEYILLCNHKD